VVETSSPAPDDTTPLRLPGSPVAYTRARIDAYEKGPPDWFPAEHPPMPAVVAKGRMPEVWACAYCHLPDGAGRPENAGLAGLTKGYIIQQIANFRSGARTGSEPRRAPQSRMTSIARSATDEEVAEAAAYYSSLRPAAHLTVVETPAAPASYVTGWMLARAPGGATEPIGSRIVEVPENLESAELRDPHTRYVAYAPVGSLKRGAELVLSGGAGRTLQCATCHGPGLRGLGDIPPITGRSPSYVMRQLYDIRGGKRAGSAVLMTVVVAHLSDEDMVAIAAYLASLPP
jgi:cytochrome c553